MLLPHTPVPHTDTNCVHELRKNGGLEKMGVRVPNDVAEKYKILTRVKDGFFCDKKGPKCRVPSKASEKKEKSEAESKDKEKSEKAHSDKVLSREAKEKERRRKESATKALQETPSTTTEKGRKAEASQKFKTTAKYRGDYVERRSKMKEDSGILGGTRNKAADKIRPGNDSVSRTP